MKNWKKALTVLLALILCFSALGITPNGESAGATQAKISNMKNQINQITSQIKDIQTKLDAVRNDKSQAVQQKQYLDEQIALSDQRIAEIDQVLAEYDVAIAEKEQEVNDLHAQEEAQYQLFCERVRAMEEHGTVSYLSIIFNAASFSELLDNVMLVGEIMDYDQGVIDMLQATRASVEQAEAELEEGKADQQALRDEEAAARAELAEQEEAASQLVQEIAQKENEYQAAIQQKENEEAQIEKEMQAAQKAFEEEQRKAREEEERRKREQQQQQQQSSGSKTSTSSSQVIVSESGFSWPLPGYLTLTSKYGWRTIFGRSEFHLGTDIPAPRGTPIQAAKTGKVTTSTSHWSYGNYVVVTHSDGTQTLYAHMSQRAVSVGQVVSQGQTIGYVGSTGNSTGNHLHFEIWVNGKRTNAENYFNLPFVRRY